LADSIDPMILSWVWLCSLACIIKLKCSLYLNILSTSSTTCNFSAEGFKFPNLKLIHKLDNNPTGEYEFHTRIVHEFYTTN
jgi:hypothetical protein